MPAIQDRYACSELAYASLCPESEAQERLRQGRVVIIGCGGLGGHVLELLLRAGVGHLRIVDGDRFTPSNLNRQLLCTEKTLGLLKVEVGRERGKEVNTEVTVEAMPVFMDADNVDALLTGAQVVVDALDSIPARRLLVRAAEARNLPLVHGAIAGFFGHATVFLPGDNGFNKLYPHERSERVEGDSLQTEIGVAPPVPALIASVQVAETIKLLLNQRENLLHGKLFLCDLGCGYAQIVTLKA